MAKKRRPQPPGSEAEESDHQPMVNPVWYFQAKEHWRKYRPKMYRELQRQGKLDEFLRKAVEATLNDMGWMLDHGSTWLEAWDVVRQRYLFPPPSRD